VITREIDCASARLVFKNGCVADVTASRVSEEKKRLLRVYDGEAIYTSDYQSQKAIVSRKGGDPVPELVMNDISTERRDTLDEEVRAFVLSIETGTRPLVSGIEGRRALALAQKITENIQKGITEFVPVA
ncbi:MAG TPA: gfo/Idh/MocA family oxidoreductase, partial [Nitrospirota bacterium]